MRITDQLTLEPISTATSTTSPVSELVVEGVATGKRVAGATLEGAAQWNSVYLLLLTDDIPYEEVLRVVLLDAHLDVVDEALIGSPYCTGAFSSLEVCDADAVKFRFIGETPWVVQLLPKPALRIPFFSEPSGVHRPFGFSRHFIIRAASQ